MKRANASSSSAIRIRISEPPLIHEPSLVRNCSTAAKTKGTQRYVGAEMARGFKLGDSGRARGGGVPFWCEPRLVRTCERANLGGQFLRARSSEIIPKGVFPTGVLA